MLSETGLELRSLEDWRLGSLSTKLVADPSLRDRNFFSLSYYAYSPVPGVGVDRRGMSERRRGVRAAGGTDRDDD